jgi:hypothetical protein
MIGGMLGALQLTAQAGQLETVDRDALKDAYDSVRRYADQLGLTKELNGDYDRIREVIEKNRPERDQGLFETGELVVACAYPGNRPSVEDLRKLEWGMKTLGITGASDILTPLRKAIAKGAGDHDAMTAAVYTVLARTIQFLNKAGSATDVKDDGRKDLTMGDVLDTVLKEHSPARSKSEYNSMTANCFLMGFWTGQMLMVANSITDGDLDVITDLLGQWAEQAQPYIEKTGIQRHVITHGYNAIVQAIESTYSSRETAAYRIGYLLGGVANPDRRFRSPQHFGEMAREIRDLGIPDVPQLEALRAALKRPGSKQVSPEVAQAGALALIALAGELEKAR